MNYRPSSKGLNHLADDSNKDIGRFDLLLSRTDRITASVNGLTLIQPITTLVVGIAALCALGIAVGGDLGGDAGSLWGAITGIAVFLLVVFIWRLRRRKRT